MPRPAPVQAQAAQSSPEYYAAGPVQAAPANRIRFVVIGVVVAVILLLALLVISSAIRQQDIQSAFNQTASSIFATNNNSFTSGPLTETPKPWTFTPSYTPNPSNTPKATVNETTF